MMGTPSVGHAATLSPLSRLQSLAHYTSTLPQRVGYLISPASRRSQLSCFSMIAPLRIVRLALIIAEPAPHLAF